MKKQKKRRNGPVWGLRSFERDVLRRFNKDLERHEDSGFGDEMLCNNVQRAIADAAAALKSATGGSAIRAQLHDLLLQEYLPIYSRWNGVGGREIQHINRRRELRLMLLKVVDDFRATRDESTPEVHKHVANHDVDQMVLAFSNLKTNYPERFPAVGIGIQRYRCARQNGAGPRLL